MDQLLERYTITFSNTGDVDIAKPYKNALAIYDSKRKTLALKKEGDTSASREYKEYHGFIELVYGGNNVLKIATALRQDVVKAMVHRIFLVINGEQGEKWTASFEKDAKPMFNFPAA